jgi:hypothetical protein
LPHLSPCGCDEFFVGVGVTPQAPQEYLRPEASAAGALLGVYLAATLEIVT